MISWPSKLLNLEANNKERQTGGADRGVSVNDPVAMATLRDAKKNVRELLIVAMTDESNTLKQIEQLEKMIHTAEDHDHDDEVDRYRKRKMALFDHLDDISARKKKLTAESDRLLGLSSPPKEVNVSNEEASNITASTACRTNSTPKSS